MNQPQDADEKLAEEYFKGLPQINVQLLSLCEHMIRLSWLSGYRSQAEYVKRLEAVAEAAREKDRNCGSDFCSHPMCGCHQELAAALDSLKEVKGGEA